jgi:hypothetical protein
MAKRTAKTKKPLDKVWVFGGGITGLTAAHELVERGFEVVVVEREADPFRIGYPALGGVARTQWVIANREPPVLLRRAGTPIAFGQLLRPLPLDMLLGPYRVVFNHGTSEIPPEAIDGLKAYAATIASTYSPLPRILVTAYRAGPEQDDVDATTRAGKVVSWLQGALNPVSGLVTGAVGPWPVPTDHSSHYCADVSIDAVPMPAEHGFRFFPAFYRHVFDTMQRIRILDDRQQPSPRAFHTVLENLVPTKTVVLALEKGGGKVEGPVNVTLPREPPRSLGELEKAAGDAFEHLAYPPEDVAHLVRKVMKYVTSGPARRKTYERLSWWSFVEGDKLQDQRCRDHVDRAPQILGGMVSREADARTQGNCLVQLLLNQLSSPFSDATMNDNTTSAWFVPWRDYLQAQGVTFVLGELTGFDVGDTPPFIRPRMTTRSMWTPELEPNDWFVLALSLPAMLDLCPELTKALAGVPAKERGDTGDVEALQHWIDGVEREKGWRWDAATRPVGPLRHLSGIQYYFDTSVHPTTGHTLYLDSAWRLSSISQLSFWSRARTPADGYRGIVSVDIGEWYTPAAKTGGPAAWVSTRRQIALEVWEQIRAAIPQPPGDVDPQEVPWPDHYHLDGQIEFAGETPSHDKAPYLITRPVDWPLRPGDPDAGYQVACRWVLAGTYMRTHTRLTTMESANESARHAVNALLRFLGFEGSRCDTWDPEELELPDLDTLKELDDHLVEAGLPHALDIL